MLGLRHARQFDPSSELVREGRTEKGAVTQRIPQMPRQAFGIRSCDTDTEQVC